MITFIKKDIWVTLKKVIRNYVDGSPIKYAKNLEGNLLYIHGTGDDNVHYQNAEMLANELIKT